MRYLNANMFAITFVPNESNHKWRAIQLRAGIGREHELSAEMVAHLTTERGYLHNTYWPECNTFTSRSLTGIMSRVKIDPKQALERYSCQTIFSRDVAVQYSKMNDELAGLP